MTDYFYIETITFICFLIFFVTSFINLDKNEFINKFIYLSNLFFLGIINAFYYIFILNSEFLNLNLITSLLLVIFLFTYFLISIFYFEFLKLRLFFIPLFLILILFRFVISITSDSSSISLDIFNDKFLLFHIFSSLLSYSMLTICAVSSFCVILKSRLIKNMKFNPVIFNILPSLYASELLTLRVLYLSMLFLFISIISGLVFHLSEYENLIKFFDYKVTLSIFCFFFIFIFLIYRSIKGCSSFTTFRLILLSYLFINFAYFGIKVYETL